MAFRQKPEISILPTSLYWDTVARNLGDQYYFDGTTGRYKSDCFYTFTIDCIGERGAGWLLKTDLFEEALGTDELFSRFSARNCAAVGIDISSYVTHRARTRAGTGSGHSVYSCADVRSLPFKPDSIEVVLSPSTLDHFEDEASFVKSIRELARVLKPGGDLILIMDNKAYFFRGLLRLKALLRISPAPVGRTYSLRYLTSVLEHEGFAMRRADQIVHVPINVVTSAVRLVARILRHNAGPIFSRVDNLLHHGPFCSFTGIYLAVHAVKQGRSDAG